MRINHVNITIGRRSTGKTVLTQRRIEIHPLKTLIVDSLDHENYRAYRAVSPKMIDDAVWKRGTIRIYGHNFDKIFYQIANKLSNAFIVFEDCTKYIRNNITEDVINFMVDSKQKNIDLCFLYHGYGMVKPDMFRLADSLTIFKTNENIDTYRSKIPNFDTVKQVNQQIKASPNNYEYRTVRIN